MRNTTLVSIFGGALAALSISAQADNLAERKAPVVPSDTAIYSPYSGDRVIVQGEVISDKSADTKAAANPYSGNQKVVQGEILKANQDS